jgi:hypothetical protein
MVGFASEKNLVKCSCESFKSCVCSSPKQESSEMKVKFHIICVAARECQFGRQQSTIYQNQKLGQRVASMLGSRML